MNFIYPLPVIFIGVIFVLVSSYTKIKFWDVVGKILIIGGIVYFVYEYAIYYGWTLEKIIDSIKGFFIKK